MKILRKFSESTARKVSTRREVSENKVTVLQYNKLKHLIIERCNGFKIGATLRKFRVNSTQMNALICKIVQTEVPLLPHITSLYHFHDNLTSQIKIFELQTSITIKMSLVHTMDYVFSIFLKDYTLEIAPPFHSEEYVQNSTCIVPTGN